MKEQMNAPRKTKCKWYVAILQVYTCVRPNCSITYLNKQTQIVSSCFFFDQDHHLTQGIISRFHSFLLEIILSSPKLLHKENQPKGRIFITRSGIKKTPRELQCTQEYLSSLHDICFRDNHSYSWYSLIAFRTDYVRF